MSKSRKVATHASVIDQFKNFGLISLGVSIAGLLIYYPLGFIGLAAGFRAMSLRKHEEIMKFKDRRLYLAIAWVGALCSALDIILLLQKN
jgi:hypothetical protein